MITIAIVSQKGGGGGKTTLAVHLASAPPWRPALYPVLSTSIPRATAAAWGDWRGGTDPEVVTAPPARLAKTVTDAETLGAQVVIVDTPPHADTAARSGVVALQQKG